MGFCSMFRRPPRRPREAARLLTGVVTLQLDKQEAENRMEDQSASSDTAESRSMDPSTSMSATQSLPGKLWNNAYDRLKARCLRLVEDYEIILSSRLTKQDVKTIEVDPRVNKISSGQLRSLQMRQLVDSGLLETSKEAATKEAVAQGLQIFNIVKQSVATATKASPEASVAWVPICFALDMLMNPLTQASSNREGIAYVISRMDWYWHLADLLLEENQGVQRSQGLQEQLEQNLVDLYARLLEYQIKSIITYHRRSGIVFARDLVKWDDWEGELTAIKEMEEVLRQGVAQFSTHEIRDQLQSIAKKAESQTNSLHNILTSIQEQTARSLEEKKSAADNACLRDLYLTNPSDDKVRLEDAEGGLFIGSYRWILENATYQQWCDDPEVRLLWIEGAPGQGKTMLLCGIIDVLSQNVLAADLLSYFFCSTSDPRNNTATAVLRGLIHHMIGQNLSLISHIRLEYDRVGKQLFSGPNSWTVLSRIFINMLDDPILHNMTVYLVVDAIDECIDPQDRKKLLSLVVRASLKYPHAQWIISSRGWNDIRDALCEHSRMAHLVLNPESESIHDAVDTYIRHKVDVLTKRKRYSPADAAFIRDYLIQNAGGTFLWVALVCRKLENSTGIFYKAAMEAFPSGLKELYWNMLNQIESLDEPEAKLSKFVLAIVLIARRPLYLMELAKLVSELDDVADKPNAMKEIVLGCGSFLSLRNDKVVVVHQSAKDYLLSEGCTAVFPNGHTAIHCHVLSRSVEAMSESYEKICDPSITERVFYDHDTRLRGMTYFTVYWLDHLRLIFINDMSGAPFLSNEDFVCTFLQRYYRPWMHDIGLLGAHSEVVFPLNVLAQFLTQRADFKDSYQMTVKAFDLASKEWKVDIVERSPEERKRRWKAMHGLGNERLDGR